MNTRHTASLILAFSMAIFSGTSQASFIGDTVQCASDGFWAVGCNPASATIGAGIEFDVLGIASGYHWSLDLGANSVVFKSLSPTQVNGGLGKVYLTGFDQESIIGITNFATDTWFGIEASDITFTSNSITIDANSSGWLPGQQLSFDIAVPEPATLSLLALGIAGFRLSRCRPNMGVAQSCSINAVR